MKEPDIVYEQIIVNNANIGEFLQVQKAAEYKAASNSIFIYDYTLGDDLNALHAKRARKIINMVRKERPRSLEHETQHWRNWCAVGDVAILTAGNYYQEVLLYYLDELSAFTAAEFYSNRHLNCHGACAESIVIAMHSAMSEFVYGAGLTFYLQDLVQYTQDGILYDLNNGRTNIAHLQRLQTRLRKKPQGLFGKRFTKAAKKYFTYDGYCIFDDKLSEETKKLWDEIQHAQKQITSMYIEQTSKTIDQIIATKTK